MIRKAPLALILAHLTFAWSAHAGGNAATLSTTRELAKQGLEAYDAGRFDEAVAKLSKAYQVVHVPTLAVATARAFVKTGKLVAASELYLEATRIPKDKSWQATQEEAQRDAEKERIELLARIPRLTIKVTGAELADVAITLDGTAVPAALADAEQMVNPGERQVEGSRGTEVVKRSVTVKEGERAQVTLEFSPAAAISGKPKAAAPAGSAPEAALRPKEGEPERGSGQKLLGWTTVAAGGVGLVVGATTGLLAMSKRSSLLESGECDKSNLSCTSKKADEVDSYNTMRTVSTVGFIAGGVLAAAGVTLLLTSPKQESKAAAGIWISPNGAAIYGGF